jgi:hypothetical protein
MRFQLTRNTWLRSLVVAAVLSATLLVVPTVGHVQVPTVFACGSQIVESAAIGSFGVVYLWENTCSKPYASFWGETDSCCNANLYAAWFFDGTLTHSKSCSNAIQCVTVSEIDGIGLYYARGCVNGNCVSTPTYRYGV